MAGAPTNITPSSPTTTTTTFVVPPTTTDSQPSPVAPVAAPTEATPTTTEATQAPEIAGWLRPIKNGIDTAYSTVRNLTNHLPAGKYLYAAFESLPYILACQMASAKLCVILAVANIAYKLLTHDHNFRPLINALGFMTAAVACSRFYAGITTRKFAPIFTAAVAGIFSLFSFTVTKLITPNPKTT